MSNDDPLKNWQLEERGEEQAQWKLQASEQGVNRNLQLQAADLPGPQWQPVEYQRVVRPRRNWVLPSIVIVALVGVLAYVGWVAFGRVGGGGFSFGSLTSMWPGASVPAAVAATATPSPEVVAAAAAASPTPAPPTPEPVPTDTPMPEPTATATPEPSPTPAVAELVTGIVNAPDGVNARSEPATTGAVVKLLTSGEQVTVVQEQADWLQVILADNRVAWVAAEFLDRSSATVPLEQVNAVLAAANLPAIGASTPLTGATVAELPPAVAEATAAPAVTFAVTVLGDPGINARTLPSTEGVVIAAVPLNSVLTAVGKSGDDLWLAVQLADGQAGWVLAQFVAPAGDVATLPVTDPAQLAAQLAATAAVTETVAPQAEATAMSPAPAPAAPPWQVR